MRRQTFEPLFCVIPYIWHLVSFVNVYNLEFFRLMNFPHDQKYEMKWNYAIINQSNSKSTMWDDSTRRGTNKKKILVKGDVQILKLYLVSDGVSEWSHEWFELRNKDIYKWFHIYPNELRNKDIYQMKYPNDSIYILYVSKKGFYNISTFTIYKHT